MCFCIWQIIRPSVQATQDQLHKAIYQMHLLQLLALVRMMNHLSYYRGDEGYVYKPVRRETGRIDKMLTDLTLSNDPLWKIISSLR